MAMVYKVRINKKYPFKQMSPGETIKLNDVDVRDAQKAALLPRCLIVKTWRCNLHLKF